MNANDLDLATNYVNGSLEEAELQPVKKRLDADPDFASLVKDLQGMQEALVEEQMAEARISIADVLQQENSHRPKRRRYYTIAAALLILGVFSVLWWRWQQPISPEALYTEYADRFSWEWKPGVAGGSNNDIHLIQGNNAEVDNSLAIAISEYKLVGSDYLQHRKLQLHIAQLQLALGESEAARKTLLDFRAAYCVQGVCPELGPEAHWYLALTYLEQGKMTEAKNELTSLLKTSGSSVLQQLALELLEQID